MYNVLRVIQVFDPSIAATMLTMPMVDDLSTVKPIAGHGLIPMLKKELPAYLTAAQSCNGFDRADVTVYTEQIFKWWKINNPAFPTWHLGTGGAHGLCHVTQLGIVRARLLPVEADVRP